MNFKTFGSKCRFYTHEFVNQLYDSPFKFLGLTLVYDFAICQLKDQMAKDQDIKMTLNKDHVNLTEKFDVIEGSSNKLCNLLSTYYYAMSAINKAYPLRSFEDKDLVLKYMCTDVNQIKFKLNLKTPVTVKVNDLSTCPELDKEFNIVKTKTYGSSYNLFIVGYDDLERRFIVLNSLGKSYGNNGISYLPYSYIELKDCSWLTKTLLTNKGNSLISKGLNMTRKILNIREDELSFGDTYVLRHSKCNNILKDIFSLSTFSNNVHRLMSKS
jgi:hypothetical protein